MTQKKNTILIADDEKEILQVLNLLLSAEGYEVIQACSGEQVLALASEAIDLYILDVNMPGMSGFAAGVELRKQYYAPIMFLTAYAGESDKVMGFSAGADDYLVKPFSNTELLLRVKALLRRSQTYASLQHRHSGHREGDHGLPYKDILLLPDQQLVKRGEETILLTYTEFKILELFVSHRKKIYSPETIYQSIWQDEPIGDSTIMVHIKNIRKKLGDDSRSPRYIRTAWGKGYYVD